MGFCVWFQTQAHTARHLPLPPLLHAPLAKPHAPPSLPRHIHCGHRQPQQKPCHHILNIALNVSGNITVFPWTRNCSWWDLFPPTENSCPMKRAARPGLNNRDAYNVEVWTQCWTEGIGYHYSLRPSLLMQYIGCGSPISLSSIPLFCTNHMYVHWQTCTGILVLIYEALYSIHILILNTSNFILINRIRTTAIHEFHHYSHLPIYRRHMKPHPRGSQLDIISNNFSQPAHQQRAVSFAISHNWDLFFFWDSPITS